MSDETTQQWNHKNNPRIDVFGEAKAFYDNVHDFVESSKPVTEMTVEKQSGGAWEMKAGQIARLVILEGAQVADLNLWNRHNSSERFWSARTRQIHGTHVKRHHRLWSTLPYLRPMVTITGDSMDYGPDEDGAAAHDLIGTRCDPYGYMLQTGLDNEKSCHTNLTKAIHPFGLYEEDVHDVINIFQVTGYRPNTLRGFAKPSHAKVGDYFEFFAELDLLCAVSACPIGDLGKPITGPYAPEGGPSAPEIVERCHPLGVEVYDLPESLLSSWTPPETVEFKGLEAYRRPK